MVAELLARSVLDQQHNEGGIWNCDPLKHGLIDLIENEIHDIHPESKLTIRSIILDNPLGQAKQVCQRGYQIVIVSTARSNGGPEDDHELIVYR